MDFMIQSEYHNKTIKDFLYREVKPSRKLLSLAKSRENGITVNGVRVTVRHILSRGDILGLNYEDCNADDSGKFIAGNYDLLKLVDILYEDDYMLAVNKPYNMPSHPSINHYGDTLANAVMAYFNKTGTKSFPGIFRAVNRLDKNTSGIVLIAKDKMTSARLNKMIKHGEIKKTYIALAAGNLEKMTPEEIRGINVKLAEINGSFGYDHETKTGKITAPVKREQDSIIKRACAFDGDYSETDFKAVKSNGDITVVEVYPKTGRTHQIRLHFYTIGFPLLGDDLYFSDESKNISLKYKIIRHALHAKSLEFVHPMINMINIKNMINNERVNLICEVCDDMRHIIKSMNTEKYGE